MNLNLFKAAIIFFIIANVTAAQNDGGNFNVKSFTIHDEIKTTDPLDEQLGRVNNFEIFLNKNDVVAIRFHTDNFLPLILFISPSGDKAAFNSKDGKNIDFTKEVNEAGNWELYIIGGNDASGTYECKISFADSAAVNPPKVFNDCNFIRFVSEHSAADFLFIKKLIDSNFSSVSGKSFKVKKSYLDSEEKLHLILEAENPKDFFDKIASDSENCFENWRIKKGKRRESAGGFETVLSMVERDNKEPGFVKIILKENVENKRTEVEMIFGRIRN